MKKITILFALVFFSLSVFAQKVKLKKEILSIDGVEVAKIKGEKNKEYMGLVKDFTVSNMDGDELLTAVYSEIFPADPNDNTKMVYEFNFIALNKTAYFNVSTLGSAKSIGNLIGKNGLLKDGQLDESAVNSLIDKKGKTPPVVVTYEMADRPRNFPVELREAGELSQASTVFCTFKDMGTVKGMDVYDFFAPDGTHALRVSFADGNNASRYVVETFKDDKTHRVGIPVKEKVKFIAAIDRNYIAIKRIGKWLVENDYL